MIEIDIPGFSHLSLDYLVLDYNGTLAIDGKLIPGVKKRLIELARKILIHVITADTFGTARYELEKLPLNLTILNSSSQAIAKKEYVSKLGANRVVAIGNGRNDYLMLQSVALGIVVIQSEGCYVETLQSAKIVCTSILDALDLVQNTNRLVATLRH